MIIKNKGMRDIEWGNSMFVMDEKTDTGDILDFEPIQIQSRDDIRTSFFKVDRSSIKMLKRTLPMIESGQYDKIKQDNSKATRFYKRKPSDGLLDFNWSSDKILNYVRALTYPYPGSFFSYKSKDIMVWRASLGMQFHGAINGEVLEIRDGKGIHVKVGNDLSIWIEYISDENDLECWADEWAKEVNLKVGDVL